MFWDKWNELKGMPKDTAKRLSIYEWDKLFAELGKLYLLENPNRPGPDYYSECKKFNWATKLVENH